MKNIKGIIFVSSLSVIAIIVSKLLSNYIKIEALTIGIILGIIVVNNFKIPKSFEDGIIFSQKKLLKYGIVLLGFKMSISGLNVLGVKSIFLVIGYISLAIFLGIYLGKLFKVNPKTSLLISLGSSICGASAIVALSDSVKAKTEDTALAVSTISLLGALGVFIYTFVFNLGKIDVIHYGLWSGLTLHGVAHAIAAAGAGGDASKEIGTMIKLLRVLMLVPVSIILSKFFKSEGKTAKMPQYLIWFIVTSIIGITKIIPSEITKYILSLSDLFILIAMTGLGLHVHFKIIKKQAKNAILMGSVLFLILSTIGLSAIITVL
ncbi:YeiH family protein [Helicovermis profundi]|uniref:Sulfate exporter family transporter n=1 Tax=Helicovermis profundi TaxID=3065157 RepID=A0AAU9E538_9FIRM|nr:putative sulfate exporter family transporter [Clostridia bacterium S502]